MREIKCFRNEWNYKLPEFRMFRVTFLSFLFFGNGTANTSRINNIISATFVFANFRFLFLPFRRFHQVVRMNIYTRIYQTEACLNISFLCSFTVILTTHCPFFFLSSNITKSSHKIRKQYLTCIAYYRNLIFIELWQERDVYFEEKRN